MPKPTAPLDKKAIKFQMENQIIEMKREKQALEKEFFKLGKRGIRKKVDLIRKTEVEKELKAVEKNLGQLKNKLRLMRLEDK